MTKNLTIFVLAIVGVITYVEGSQFPPADSFNNCDLKNCNMQEKKCTKCGEVKLLSKFIKCTKHKDGLTSRCRECLSKSSRKYRRTKEGLVSKIYSGQKESSKARGYNPPTYTNQELKDWCFSQKLFHELYDNWKASGFKIGLSPSCDRTNDYLGYSLSRLQLMMWNENRLKGDSDRKNGINNKASKAVIGIHKITGEKVEFYSHAEANRQTGIARPSISNCCNGLRKSAGGYMWEFKN